MLLEGRFTAEELAEFAQAAFELGCKGLGQGFVTAAYNRADGLPCGNIGRLLAELRHRAMKGGHDAQLATTLTKLLGRTSYLHVGQDQVSARTPARRRTPKKAHQQRI